MTVEERAASYARAFPDYPPLVTHGRWLYGVWMIGNDYKGSGFYGAYPPSYLRRVEAVLPEMRTAPLLHLFAGSLGSDVRGVRVDCNPERRPTIAGDAEQLPFATGSFGVCCADPPYSHADAVRYNTPMVDRRKVLQVLARVLRPGGQLAWLDTTKPMYRKDVWNYWGSVMVERSTNHRVRAVFFFERRAA